MTQPTPQQLADSLESLVGIIHALREGEQDWRNYDEEVEHAAQLLLAHNPDDELALRCPACDYTERFQIVADMWVTVPGHDYTHILEEGGDREYGSESACHCPKCHHQSRLGDFRVVNQPA